MDRQVIRTTADPGMKIDASQPAPPAGGLVTASTAPAAAPASVPKPLPRSAIPVASKSLDYPRRFPNQAFIRRGESALGIAAAFLAIVPLAWGTIPLAVFLAMNWDAKAVGLGLFIMAMGALGIGFYVAPFFMAASIGLAIAGLLQKSRRRRLAVAALVANAAAVVGVLLAFRALHP